MDTTSDVTTDIKVWSSGTMICATRTIFRHPSTKLRVGDQTLSHTPIRLSAATVSVRASSSSRRNYGADFSDSRGYQNYRALP